jgi:hypothetical protein
MSHAANRPESGDREPRANAGGRVRPAVTLAGVVGVIALGVVCLPGCGKPPTAVTSDVQKAEKGKPWEDAGKRLRKETDPAACRTVLGSLNNDLPGASAETPRPSALASDAEEALAKLVPLNPEDRNEIRPAEFTAHDSAYLAECLYLRDVVRAFDSPARPGETPEQAAARRADAGFAWVCRQVYLNPWLIPVPGDRAIQATALPPTYVLRRGYGSGLERMYVFLALLQQMGLDGCLVGPEGAGKLPAGFVAYAPDKTTVLTGSPRGPFWAVGVRVGPDVRLYDPWRGRAFPVPLSQLRSNPDAQKAWFEDKANVSGITAAAAKTAEVCLAVPVNSLAPRMAVLEKELKADVGVRVSVNAAALRESFPDPKPAYWNLPGDPLAYGRTARVFLPVEEGGTDRTEPGPNRMFEMYLWSQLPPVGQFVSQDLLADPDVRDDVAERIVFFARIDYGTAFIHPPPTPRERLQRGQFQDAARDLVTRRDKFAHGLELLRNTPDADQQIKQWAEEAVRLYARKGRALTDGDRAAVEAAHAALDAHWGKELGSRLLVSRAVSTVGLAEATMLVALSRHERAELAQARLDRAPGDAKLRQEAADAWSDALAGWQTYAEHAAAQAALPGRAAHVKTLTARAQEMAAKK